MVNKLRNVLLNWVVLVLAPIWIIPLIVAVNGRQFKEYWLKGDSVFF